MKFMKVISQGILHAGRIGLVLLGLSALKAVGWWAVALALGMGFLAAAADL